MLYQLMKRVHELFESNRIKYFMIGGILIGLRRHNNGFIPWDDDLDIGVDISDRQRVREIVNKTEDLYILENNLDKICFKYDQKVGNYDENVFIDIFYFEPKEDLYQFAFPEHRKLWPNEFFMKNELFPLKTTELKLYLPDGKTFDSMPVIVPRDIDIFLNRAYPNCMNKMMVSHSHITMYKNPIHKRIEEYKTILEVIAVMIVIIVLLKICGK